MEKRGKKKGNKGSIKMSDKVAYRLLVKHTIPQFQHQETMPQPARKAGRSLPCELSGTPWGAGRGRQRIAAISAA